MCIADQLAGLIEDLKGETLSPERALYITVVLDDLAGRMAAIEATMSSHVRIRTPDAR